jgi:L-malate glycosyltransferase
MNWNIMDWKIKSFLANAIVARNTTLLQTYLSGKKLKEKTYFISGGVDVDLFKPGIDLQARKQYNISTDACVVTCVAQLVRVKDQLTLVKAINNIDNVVLVLAGAEKDEEYAHEIQLLVNELGIQKRVVFANNVSDVAGLLRASNVFVLPTSKIGGHEEGSPVALLEAMSTGLPCIASNVAGSSDLIKNNVTGLLFEAGYVDALESSIRKYMEDKTFAKRMGANARQMVCDNYTLDIEATKFSELYKSLVA